MLLSKTLQFYKRKDVQRAILEQAEHKEIAIRFTDYFGKRPDTIMYANDVLELAKKKATSFHCSEELWTNPLQLRTDIKKQEMDELRRGWDLILDIDCPYWPLSRIITHLFVKALQAHGIKSITTKFSGNKGFHIAVPFEAFPKVFNGQPTKDLFPEAPRKIAAYLVDFIKNNFVKIKAEENIFVLDNKYKLSVEKVKDLINEYNIKSDSSLLNPLMLIEVDTILIAPRHLYRMPYSMHEKSGLVSVPIPTNKILSFKKSRAEPENVKTDTSFLNRESATEDEAKQLFISAYDFTFDETKITNRNKEQKEFTIPEEAIREELFPPCIRNMLSGMKDGKKRTLFTLINFYKGAGWGVDAIDQRMDEWNKQNPEPLREVYLNGQVRQAKKTKEAIPPHNCKSYYQDLGVCSPDSFCAKIKNPLQYAKLKAEMEKTKTGARKTKITPEQLEARRKFREKKKKEEEQESPEQTT